MPLTGPGPGPQPAPDLSSLLIDLKVAKLGFRHMLVKKRSRGLAAL